MKSFDLLRYLKKWWFLIMLITAVGCLGVYEFISSRQSYTATAIIQYTNANASQGRNADGSRIDPTEITSGGRPSDRQMSLNRLSISPAR